MHRREGSNLPPSQNTFQVHLPSRQQTSERTEQTDGRLGRRQSRHNRTLTFTCLQYHTDPLPSITPPSALFEKTHVEQTRPSKSLTQLSVLPDLTERKSRRLPFQAFQSSLDIDFDGLGGRASEVSATSYYSPVIGFRCIVIVLYATVHPRLPYSPLVS